MQQQQQVKVPYQSGAANTRENESSSTSSPTKMLQKYKTKVKENDFFSYDDDKQSETFESPN